MFTQLTPADRANLAGLPADAEVHYAPGGAFYYSERARTLWAVVDTGAEYTYACVGPGVARALVEEALTTGEFAGWAQTAE